ncbi:hypothetical protein ACWY5W_004276, partial [Shigella flexneri]
MKYQLSTVGFQSWIDDIPFSKICLHTIGLLATSGSTGKYLVVNQVIRSADKANNIFNADCLIHMLMVIFYLSSKYT